MQDSSAEQFTELCGIGSRGTNYIAEGKYDEALGCYGLVLVRMLQRSTVNPWLLAKSVLGTLDVLARKNDFGPLRDVLSSDGGSVYGNGLANLEKEYIAARDKIVLASIKSGCALFEPIPQNDRLARVDGLMIQAIDLAVENEADLTPLIANNWYWMGMYEGQPPKPWLVRLNSLLAANGVDPEKYPNVTVPDQSPWVPTDKARSLPHEQINFDQDELKRVLADFPDIID